MFFEFVALAGMASIVYIFAKLGRNEIELFSKILNELKLINQNMQGRASCSLQRLGMESCNYKLMQMPIDNDFLEFLNLPTCKKAMLIITLFIFLTITVQEIAGGSTAFMQSMGISSLTFWAGRASKSNKK